MYINLAYGHSYNLFAQHLHLQNIEFIFDVIIATPACGPASFLGWNDLV